MKKELGTYSSVFAMYHSQECRYLADIRKIILSNFEKNGSQAVKKRGGGRFRTTKFHKTVQLQKFIVLNRIVDNCANREVGRACT
jgi:hypothetical protein